MLGTSAVSCTMHTKPSTVELGDLGITRGACVIHAERGLARMTSLFRDHSKAKVTRASKHHTQYAVRTCAYHNHPFPLKVDNMKNCIEHLKAYPHELHEGCIQQLMLEKWSARPSRGGYGERAVAQKWGASWGNSEWTLLRCGLHTHGGLPPDNQGLEGKNGSQKETLAAWRRRQLTVFVPMFFPWMENESLEDLQFGMGLPRAKCGVKEIHSTLFYASVEDELLRQQAGTGIFSCLFADATDREVMFIPSRRTITTLLEDHAVPDTKAVPSESTERFCYLDRALVVGNLHDARCRIDYWYFHAADWSCSRL